MSMRKSDAIDYLRAHGLVVEGDEQYNELQEACGHMRRYLKARGLA